MVDTGHLPLDSCRKWACYTHRAVEPGRVLAGPISARVLLRVAVPDVDGN